MLSQESIQIRLPSINNNFIAIVWRARNREIDIRHSLIDYLSRVYLKVLAISKQALARSHLICDIFHRIQRTGFLRRRMPERRIYLELAIQQNRVNSRLLGNLGTKVYGYVNRLFQMIRSMKQTIEYIRWDPNLINLFENVLFNKSIRNAFYLYWQNSP